MHQNQTADDWNNYFWTVEMIAHPEIIRLENGDNEFFWVCLSDWLTQMMLDRISDLKGRGEGGWGTVLQIDGQIFLRGAKLFFCDSNSFWVDY